LTPNAYYWQGNLHTALHDCKNVNKRRIRAANYNRRDAPLRGFPNLLSFATAFAGGCQTP
jgi:hypothetical protein